MKCQAIIIRFRHRSKITHVHSQVRRTTNSCTRQIARSTTSSTGHRWCPVLLSRKARERAPLNRNLVVSVHLLVVRQSEWKWLHRLLTEGLVFSRETPEMVLSADPQRFNSWVSAFFVDFLVKNTTSFNVLLYFPKLHLL